MARRRGRRSQRTSAKPVRSLTVRLSRPPVYVPRREYRDIEDRRRYHPLKLFAPPKLFSGKPARVTVQRVRRRRSVVPIGIRFLNVERVLVCARRKERREVLFATNKTGGGVRRKKPRRTPFSEVSCKR